MPRGEKILETVVQQRISELRVTGRELVRAIAALLHNERDGTSAGK
jgi:hypothetical protein